MTSVGTVGSTPSYAQIIANAQKSAHQPTATASGTTGAESSATTVTLSDAAKAALAGKDFATVTADARAAMDALLEAAKLASPLEDGALAIDLGTLDRRELYAISTNGGQQFTVEEQKAAAIELQNRFDQALAGPTAVGRVTGSIKGLYTAALAWFDGMGPEEKASATHADQRAALEQMLHKIEADPATLPGAVANDPVDAYMQRLAAGETGGLRDIASVAADARATLDALYKAGAGKPDYSDFDSRSIAAVALNSGDRFSVAESRAAGAEMRSRAASAVLQGLKASGSSSDPGAFAQNIISLYGAMSSEERAAAGWSENLYAAAVANYHTASKLAAHLGAATGSPPWGAAAGAGSGSGSGSGSFSLMDYL